MKARFFDADGKFVLTQEIPDDGLWRYIVLYENSIDPGTPYERAESQDRCFCYREIDADANELDALLVRRGDSPGERMLDVPDPEGPVPAQVSSFGCPICSQDHFFSDYPGETIVPCENCGIPLITGPHRFYR